MKKKTKNILSAVVCILLFLAFVAFVVYNAIKNAEFWEASAANCTTIAIAIVISYYFVQRRNDDRKQKDIILDLIFKVQTQLKDRSMYIFDGQSKEEILMRNRDISNRLHILDTIKDEFSIAVEIDFVNQKFAEYENLIGDGIDNLEHLCSLPNALKRPIDLIDTKLFEAAIKLYK